MLLGESQQIRLTISEQVVAETERAVARKIPAALSLVRQAILRSRANILPDPPSAEVEARLGWMTDPTDIPILVAAMIGQVDFLATLNRKHFLDDPIVAQRAGLRMGTPGDALTWVRGQLTAS